MYPSINHMMFVSSMFAKLTNIMYPSHCHITQAEWRVQDIYFYWSYILWHYKLLKNYSRDTTKLQNWDGVNRLMLQLMLSPHGKSKWGQRKKKIIEEFQHTTDARIGTENACWCAAHQDGVQRNFHQSWKKNTVRYHFNLGEPSYLIHCISIVFF